MPSVIKVIEELIGFRLAGGFSKEFNNFVEEHGVTPEDLKSERFQVALKKGMVHVLARSYPWDDLKVFGMYFDNVEELLKSDPAVREGVKAGLRETIKWECCTPLANSLSERVQKYLTRTTSKKEDIADLLPSIIPFCLEKLYIRGLMRLHKYTGIGA